jgi:hypothetical protein
MRDLHMHVQVTLALVALVALGALERRAREVHVLHNRVANNFSFSPNSNSSVYVQNTGTGTLPWYNSNSDLWDTRYWTCWFIPKSKIWIWLHCKHFHNYYLLIFYGGLRTKHWNVGTDPEQRAHFKTNLLTWLLIHYPVSNKYSTIPSSATIQALNYQAELWIRIRIQWLCGSGSTTLLDCLAIVV